VVTHVVPSPARTMASEALMDVLSTVVFDVLKKKIAGLEKCALVIDEKYQRDKGELKRHLKAAILKAYIAHVNNFIDINDVCTAEAAAKSEVDRIWDAFSRQEKVDQKTLVQMAAAFTAEYIGDADTQFADYLARCCSAYEDYPDHYTAPYVAITQSSGFGKSRILRRLAESTNDGTLLKCGDDSFDATVLYVCARNVKGSTGYPRATPALTTWFFDASRCTEEEMAVRLRAAFTCAFTDREATRSEWLKLFANKVNESVDQGIVDELEDKRRKGDQPVPKKQRMDESSGDGKKRGRRHSTQAPVPVLVLAIDEARALFDIKNPKGENAFQILRRALKIANGLKTETGFACKVFAVLVDTNSQVHDFVPALSKDPSSRKGEATTALFPPFVLTHTMDVMLHCPASGFNRNRSKSRVLEADPTQIWDALVSMGRPLWHSKLVDAGLNLFAEQITLNVLAASKLLLGCEHNDEKSYDDTTLHGVASLFCRVGLRPHESDAMSTRMVADFMSVLHYVTHKNDAHISSYASDPILTFGAARVWYQLDKPALESHILRQFQAMLINGVVDTGNIGEIVARIFLLLAMDATIMGMDVWEKPEVRREFVFTGQFCQVLDFVAMLVGAAPELRMNDSKADLEDRAQYDALERWKGWKIGFSHFVDLPKMPTEEVLWKLLDRRAAGILPRNQKGADLIIPMFSSSKETAVSFILVQVKNRVDKDEGFPISALANLTPSNVFKDGSPLRDTQPCDMIRLYMSLREAPSDGHPAQCVLVLKPLEGHVATPINYSVCVRGMFAPDADTGTANQTRWPFLSRELTKQLIVLANSAWWDGRTRVERDLDNRDRDIKSSWRLSQVLPRETAVQVASKTLDMFSPSSV